MCVSVRVRRSYNGCAFPVDGVAKSGISVKVTGVAAGTATCNIMLCLCLCCQPAAAAAAAAEVLLVLMRTLVFAG